MCVRIFINFHIWTILRMHVCTSSLSSVQRGYIWCWYTYPPSIATSHPSNEDMHAHLQYHLYLKDAEDVGVRIIIIFCIQKILIMLVCGSSLSSVHRWYWWCWCVHLNYVLCTDDIDDVWCAHHHYHLCTEYTEYVWCADYYYPLYTQDTDDVWCADHYYPLCTDDTENVWCADLHYPLCTKDTNDVWCAHPRYIVTSLPSNEDVSHYPLYTEDTEAQWCGRT